MPPQTAFLFGRNIIFDFFSYNNISKLPHLRLVLFQQLLGEIVGVEGLELVPLLLTVVALVPEVDQLHPGGDDELTDLLRLEHLELVHLPLQFPELCRGVPLQVPDLGVDFILL